MAVITRFIVSEVGISHMTFAARCAVYFGSNDSFLTDLRKTDIAEALLNKGLLAPSPSFDYSVGDLEGRRSFIVALNGVDPHKSLIDVRVALEDEVMKVLHFVSDAIKRWQAGDVINQTIDPLLKRPDAS